VASAQWWASFDCFATAYPARRSARATNSGVMISRMLPKCTVPDGVMPAAST
jgi:hypothetical protein